VGGWDTCGGDPRTKAGRWSAARGSGARQGDEAQPRPGRRAGPVGPSGVGGALRGPSPGDKGPAAHPSHGAALALRCGRGRASSLPGPPDPAGPAGAAGPKHGARRPVPGRAQPEEPRRRRRQRQQQQHQQQRERTPQPPPPLGESPRRGGREAPGRRGRDRRRGRHLNPRWQRRRGDGNAPKGGRPRGGRG
jgi:hypothetical protein